MIVIKNLLYQPICIHDKNNNPILVGPREKVNVDFSSQNLPEEILSYEREGFITVKKMEE